MSNRHILVIKDDTGIQAVTEFSLEIEDNWKVTTAFCGKEGLVKARTLHPDVILIRCSNARYQRTRSFKRITKRSSNEKNTNYFIYS